MEIIRLTDKNGLECITRAVEVLQRGGIVLYPTDTLYGLGADALANGAVDKIYALKGREATKPMHCIVSDMVMAERYAEIDSMARLLSRHFLPGPLTLILKKREMFDTGIARVISTIGIRIPNSEFCMEMVKMFRKPITTTSANVSEKAVERDIDKILEQFGDKKHMIDLVIDGGELPENQPSTVVDISGVEPVMVREGAIDRADIWEIFRAEPRGS